MKKVVVASLLAFSAATGMTVGSHVAFAQNPVNLGSQASSDVQMSPAEYKDYNDAISLTDPKAKAAGIEAYLTKYPQSAVKSDTLQTLMLTYSSFDPTKTLDAADRLLQVDPSNLRALTFEVYFRKASADAIADPAGKQAALDAAAGFAQKGLAVTKPAKMSDADFKTVQDSANPIFYSAIGTAALNKKDSPTAIENFKKELASVPVATTQTPGPVLQDTYFLGLAYLQSTPPDLLNCTYYVSRFVAFAPEPYKSQLAPTAKYCYKRYHGSEDGYDAVVTAASANLNPPDGFTVTPAPKASDIAHKTVAETADLATLALSDKEFILQNGTPEDAEKVFATIKGKSVQIPDATVVTATDSSVQVSVSDDAVQSKTADFTFTMKEPLKTVPTAGAKIALTGTYDAYTQSPLMITMTGGEVVEPKKAPAKKAAAPVRRAAPRKK
ncbi:hypothetical protein BH10ACI4_BH10ACI4_09300 [soil metagenome]